mmetsp:Transcript_70833/g.140528  ORF Transcript_70833/g.140528 Transcript_70833/m.140528 type:complete len:221 (+) Transcript_70833:1088-1750(+)
MRPNYGSASTMESMNSTPKFPGRTCGQAMESSVGQTAKSTTEIGKTMCITDEERFGSTRIIMRAERVVRCMKARGSAAFAMDRAQCDMSRTCMIGGAPMHSREGTTLASRRPMKANSKMASFMDRVCSRCRRVRLSSCLAAITTTTTTYNSGPALCHCRTWTPPLLCNMRGALSQTGRRQMISFARMTPSSPHAICQWCTHLRKIPGHQKRGKWITICMN